MSENQGAFHYSFAVRLTDALHFSPDTFATCLGIQITELRPIDATQLFGESLHKAAHQSVIVIHPDVRYYVAWFSSETALNHYHALHSIRRRASAVRRVIGYVPQMLSTEGTLTGYENLLMFARLYDIPRRERKTRIRNALKFMGVEEDADRLVRTYSGGMVRRLEIAQSILHRPPVLFLDEPTVGLDPLARKAVWEHVEQLRNEYGTTILMTTHLMEEADSMCDRVAIMHRGKVVALGRPDDLKASVGREGATLEDVFIHYTGSELESGGSYRDVFRTRRTAQRLG